MTRFGRFGDPVTQRLERRRPGLTAGGRVIWITRFTGVRSRPPRRRLPTLSGVAHRFRLVGTLGQGGTAVVYDAIDLVLGRRVALKFLAEGTERESREALAREADALARIADPHACVGYGIAEYDHLPCLVMERLRGRDLKQHLASRTLSIAEVVRLAIQMADGLNAIHRAGLVHNDIKPANVFVTATGPRFLDFGLATRVASTAPTAQRRPWRDSVFGTADYIAPERILRRPVTPQSDLFSYGAVVYEMLTGVKPFTGASTSETVFNVLDAQPASVTRLRPDCPPSLARIVARLLAKRPERRFPSAAALSVALRRVLRHVHQPSPSARSQSTSKVEPHATHPQRLRVPPARTRGGARCHA